MQVTPHMGATDPSLEKVPPLPDVATGPAAVPQGEISPAAAGTPVEICQQSDEIDDPARSGTPHPPADLPQEVLLKRIGTSVDALLQQIGRLVVDDQQNAYVVTSSGGNPLLLKVGSSELQGLIASALRRGGQSLAKKAVAETMDELRAEAASRGARADVWRRVAQLPDGTRVIALYDELNTQVWISPGQVKIVSVGSEVLFYRTPSSRPMAMPAAVGDWKLLKKYLNLDHPTFLLCVAWITYTLAHAKKPGNAYVVLALLGGQGTGKSLMSKLLIRLIDPNVVGVERLPRQVKDVAIAAQGFHLLAYDNLRQLPPDMSDALCTLSTRGALTGRKLYSDDDQHVLMLHGALLLNGIHAFVEQPDLAQRCLTFRLDPVAEVHRQSETSMLAAFEGDLPAIQRGLFEEIAKVLIHLPEVKVIYPQRMYGFVEWLAAMEAASGIPAGTYQQVYADLINEGQLDSLRDNILGSAVLDFAEKLEGERWSGTPAELLIELNMQMQFGHQRPPRGWPDNEIALSKRLLPQLAALMTQGVEVHSTRGKHRTFTISKKQS